MTTSEPTFRENVGPARYRVDWTVTDPRDQSVTRSLITNNEGEGLFFLNGRGDNQQTHGTSQFQARTLHQFRSRVAPMLAAYLAAARETA